jgi:CRISPR/Cas system-associated exonuclease Cas4 (RecB family)
VKDAVTSAIKEAGRYISGCYIRDGHRILIPRDTIEKFKEYSKKIHSRITEQQVTGFPCEPRKSCDRCGFRQICTDGDDNGAE